jgi:hypothetical protein
MGGRSQMVHSAPRYDSPVSDRRPFVHTSGLSGEAVMSDYYRVGQQPLTTDDIALFAFGGVFGDPIGAKVRVDGWTRVRIMVPQAVYDDAEDAFPAFQAAVRKLARTYDIQGFRHGPIDIVWKPVLADQEWQYDEAGEPVERVV